MDTTNHDSLIMEALTELAPEIAAARAGQRPARPRLSQVLAAHRPLPRTALFLGVAHDGLPVLLNMLDPVPGPMLITGDAGSGKTSLLQTIGRAVERMHSAEDVQYGVITAQTEEWAPSPAKHRVDVFPSFDKEAGLFINSLASWAHSNRGERQSVLLLIDDLRVITRMDFDARQNLRWLLLRGPARRVWPIVTLNAGKAEAIHPWLDFFRTRCFGAIKDQQELQFLADSTDRELTTLNASTEFAMREEGRWLKFWTPTLD